jgi:hypothetical protein
MRFIHESLGDIPLDAGQADMKQAAPPRSGAA